MQGVERKDETAWGAKRVSGVTAWVKVGDP